jgi:hypothetical protein
MGIGGLMLPRTGVVIDDCVDKVRHFCQFDAYLTYDVVGRKFASEPSQFHPDLLTATNRAMMARSSRSAWKPFLGIDLPELAAIPLDVDLVESSGQAYVGACDALRRYYLRIAEAKWLTDMAASKMLYLKRPMLTAISDSYIREALRVEEPRGPEFPWKAPWCAERALRVSHAVREVGQANRAMLSELRDATAEYGLSLSRLIDILVWVEAATAAKHRMWSDAARASGWVSEKP